MCGIVGGIGELRPSTTSMMLSSIIHRGPDGVGEHIRPRVMVGSARLAIVDVDGGKQPMYSADSQHCIVFNGEIYNYRSIRTRLRKRGCNFYSTTDSEVVLQQFLEYGPAGIAELSGMYAFCITGPDWLFIARDPLGIKPLYMYQSSDGASLLFASEIKALLQAEAFSPSVDMTAVADWLLIGYPGGNRTFIQEVRCVPPGKGIFVRLTPRLLRCEYYSIGDDSVAYNFEAHRDAEAEGLFHRLLVSATQTCLDADVEVGIALSGGIDSSLLAALAGRPVRSFTVAEREDDADLLCAREVARCLGFRHHECVIDPQDYFRSIALSVVIEEQPASLGALPLYFLCQEMSLHLRSALIGEGADELFGGYREYLEPESYLNARSGKLVEINRAGFKPSLDALELTDTSVKHRNDRDPLATLFHLNLGSALVREHLEIVDKYSMATGVEFRLPYLDNFVYKAAMAVPVGAKVCNESRRRKILLRELVNHHLGPPAEHVLKRKKQGFPSSGLGLAGGFSRYCERLVSNDYVRKHPLASLLPHKYMLIMFDLFQELVVANLGRRPDSFDVAEFVRSRS